jgi:hypothetical protein
MGECFGRGITNSNKPPKKKSKEKEGIYNVKVTILKIQPGWLKFLLELVFYVKLKDMLL